MSVERQQGPCWPEPLASRLSADAGVEQVVAAVMALWRDIEQALCPIVGARGHAALFNRSLKLVSTAYPWLDAGRGGVLDAVDMALLEAALRRQPVAEAAAGAAALFQSFRDLLASLVGTPLTERLLRSVWAPSTGSPPAQDLPS